MDWKHNRVIKVAALIRYKPDCRFAFIEESMAGPDNKKANKGYIIKNEKKTSKGGWGKKPDYKVKWLLTESQ